jgi:hypothetical protein
MKRKLTAPTLPRISSGVECCSNDTRITALTQLPALHQQLDRAYDRDEIKSVYARSLRKGGSQ